MDWRVLRFSWMDVVEHPASVVDAVSFELAKVRPTNTQTP